MLTYQAIARVLSRHLWSLSALVFAVSSIPRPGEAQERRNLFELGAAGALQSYNNDTGLDGSFGGLGRFGLWLPLNFSVEAEGSLAKANGLDVKIGSASLLYNLLLGSATWGYAKAGIGGTRYGPGGDACQLPEFVGKICGTTTTFVGGLGVRFPLSPVLLIRAEGVVNPNKGTTVRQGATAADTTREDVSFSNFGLNL